MQEASLRTLTTSGLHVSLFMFYRIKEKTDLRRKVCYFPCCTDYHVFLPSPIPNRRFGSNRWFIDEGPGCTIKRLPSLTPTTTVSSPWNLGRNWSPRKISDWFRGRKRHSTFMLHSAGTSAIAQIQGGGRMLLSVERKDAPEAAGDQSLIGAWSHRQNKRRGGAQWLVSSFVQRTLNKVERLDGFILTSCDWLQFNYAQLKDVFRRSETN